MAGALDDIVVLELASWIAGPSCAALMADMGATVIKVEPLKGDGMRGMLRQPATPPGAAAHDVPFQMANRGKRSIAVDIASPKGAEVVRRLAGVSDVVITNVTTARLARYGLAPDALRSLYPRLIVGIVTGYGTDGDDADRSAFDLTAFFGRAGVMSLLGEPDAPPPTPRPGQGDHPTGLALLAAVLAALRHRDKTGEGQTVETALLRVGAWTVGCDVSVALVDEIQPTKRGRAEVFSPMNNTYECGDGRWLTLSAQDQHRWEPLCRLIGRPDLAVPPWDDAAARFKDRRRIIAELETVFASQPAAHWYPLLDESTIVWAPVATMPDLIADPQAEAIGMWAELDHPGLGTFRTLAAPFRMDGSAVEVRGRAPEVGEHTDAILSAAGFDEEEAVALRTAGVIR